MQTNIEHERMMIISDLHLGNIAHNTKDEILNFLDYSIENKYNICLNGDILDIIQTSFAKFTYDVPDFLAKLHEFDRNGLKIYYIIGNHDIIFEYFMSDLKIFTPLPFMNLTSGNKRIHIEHGHLHDPLFMKNPYRYERLGRMSKILIRLSNSLFRYWQKRVVPGLYNSLYLSFKKRIINSAYQISRRGFDYVIFGHTHAPMCVALPNGAYYINNGTWLIPAFHYTKIDNGNVTWNEWNGKSILPNLAPSPYNNGA